MDMSQNVSACDRSQLFSQLTRVPPSEHSSLAVATEILDAALQFFDDDRVRTKSQIRVAAALLRGYTDDSAMDAKSPAASTGESGLAPWQARKVREFIETSIDSTIRLTDCAKRAKLSAGYFSHAFKATFGTTVCQYVRRRRVEHSQQLMLLSQETLSQIALACGFADQAHFCRVFREAVGVSPRIWRRRNMTLAPGE
jgi:AraC-like DNA-binding protein